MTDVVERTAQGLRFTVLRGTVGAEVDGEAVSLGGPMQRKLLAALLAGHDSIVSADRLVESIWPEGQAPDGARRTVMSYVSRLRSSIGGDHLVTRDAGYQLVLDGAAYDVAEFELVLAEARASTDAAAIDAYGRALALWSGRAFGEDAAEWWLQPVAARLEELRLVAEEERADLLIELGRPADAVVELEQLVAQHPLRERFVELLMRALYLGGRQAEALRAYRRFGDYLADETGLDPSHDLVELEHRITMGDSSLAPATGVAVPGYELGEVIGVGAFGSVYRATQPSIGREVAIKVVLPELADDPQFVQRFEAEAQLVARIEHPHVVPLYDYWRRPGGAFLVFRLLRGGTLSERIAEGPLPLDQVDRVVEEMCGALGAAHALGVVHRDVKPANVIFDEVGNSYLADFGIAVDAAATDIAPELRAAGSPMYASPEQARDGVATAASDQYSLAVLAWEALTAAAPFAGTSTTEVLRTKFSATVPDLDSVGDAPEAVARVLQRSSSPNPADRYPTIGAFAEAWRTAIGGSRPGVARTTNDLGSGGSPARTASATMASLPAVGANPFKGLRAFREADAAEFCGRGALVDRLVTAIADAPFVVVVGPSGSGKSSLVHAGVVPEFRRRGALVVSMVPGTDPFAELEAALQRVTTLDDELAVRPRLHAPGGLVAIATELVAPGGELVLVIDQFEELFTLVTSDATRDRFADLLARAAAGTGPLRIVATLRADLYDRPLEHLALGPLVSDATFAVTPMSPAELAEAVETPAGMVGVRFESGLVATIVNDVGTRPGALPLLQFTLTELFELRTNATITAHAYEEIGGIGGALASRAEQLYTDLDEIQRGDVRALFTQLVMPRDDADDLRRRASFEELQGIDRTVIERYRENRLLVTDHHPITREPTIEVAHEALLREWPRLQTWIDDERDTIRQRRSLGHAAAEWAEQGRDESALLRGTRLVAANEIADAARLTNVEREYLAASRELADREHVEAEARVVDQLRQNHRLRRLVTATAVALVLALLAGLVAVGQRGNARDSAARATSAALASRRAATRSDLERLVADSERLAVTNPDLSRLLAAEAARRSPGALAADALATSLLTDPDLLGYLGDTNEPRGQAGDPTGWPAFSPDSTELAFPDDRAGEIRIVALPSGRERRRLPIPVMPGKAIVLSTHWLDDDMLVIVGIGSVAGIDAKTGAVRVAPTTVRGEITSADVSADGRRIAVVSTTTATAASVTVIPLDASGPAVTGEVPCCTAQFSVGTGHVVERFPGAVAWNGDDLYVASGHGTIQQWDPETANPTRTIGDAFGPVWRMNFSADGSRLYVNAVTTETEPGGPKDGTLQAYRTSDWSPIWKTAPVMLGFAVDDPAHHAVRVTNTFSAGGLYTLDRDTGARDGRAYDGGTGPPCLPFLSPDAAYLATGSCDRAALMVWSLNGGGALLRPLPVPAWPYQSVNPSGTHMVLANGIQTADVDLRTGRTTSMPGIVSAILASTGRLFVLDAAGTVQASTRPVEVPSADVPMVVTGRKQRQPTQIDVNDEAGRYAVSYDPNSIEVRSTAVNDQSIVTIVPERGNVSSYVLTADAKHLYVTARSTLLRYDLAHPDRPKDMGLQATHVALTPDRQLLAVSLADGTLTFRDPETLERIGHDIQGGSTYPLMAMSADGSTLATTKLGSMGLFDMKDRRALGPVVEIDPQSGLVMAPDSSKVYVERNRKVVAVTLDRAKWLATACQSAGRNLTKVEWATYLDGEPHKTCEQWPAPR